MTSRNFRFRGETQTLDEAARAAVSGDYVELADGITHYELGGPPEGQPVVLVCGFAVPYPIWNPTFDFLTENGYRVLRYDLFGRGYSDRPDLTYNADLYDRQLLDLLSALEISPPVDLLGLSMGGPIVAVFADRHPDLVRRLGLVDPAGFTTRYRWLIKVLKTPILGEWLMSLFGDWALLSDLEKDLLHFEGVPEFIEKSRDQMKFTGYKQALLSTMRHGSLNNMGDTFRRVGEQNRPTLLLWGREDDLVPFKTHKKFLKAIPHIEFHAIDQAGHIPHFERPEVVNPILLEFLKK